MVPKPVWKIQLTETRFVWFMILENRGSHDICPSFSLKIVSSFSHATIASYYYLTIWCDTLFALFIYLTIPPFVRFIFLDHGSKTNWFLFSSLVLFSFMLKCHVASWWCPMWYVLCLIYISHRTTVLVSSFIAWRLLSNILMSVRGYSQCLFGFESVRSFFTSIKIECRVYDNPNHLVKWNRITPWLHI